MATVEIDDDITEESETECGCDFVQIIFDQGDRIELHHVIPDDGAPHVEDVKCGCSPGIERLEHDLIVVDHKDQDVDWALDGEGDAWASSSVSTGAGSAPSAPGSC